MLNSINEHLFKSGFRISYVFSEVDDSLNSDFLEELNDFEISGPFTESLNDKSPKYQESLLSRRLLLDLLKSFKKKHVGGVSFSLSHTRGAALVAGAASLAFEGANLASGVGVDLESNDRKISGSAHTRIINGGLDSLVDPMRLWSLKEASYKAHPENDDLLLSDFYVDAIQDENSFYLKCKATQKEFETVVMKQANYSFCLARLI